MVFLWVFLVVTVEQMSSDIVAKSLMKRLQIYLSGLEVRIFCRHSSERKKRPLVFSKAQKLVVLGSQMPVVKPVGPFAKAGKSSQKLQAAKSLANWSGVVRPAIDAWLMSKVNRL